MTVLLNEIFLSLFAENAPYICAVTPGSGEVPITCFLEGEDGCVPDENAIYIIEDSQLDIGLLIAVERNLQRIFSVACDYLNWHLEELDLGGLGHGGHGVLIHPAQHHGVRRRHRRQHQALEGHRQGDARHFVEKDLVGKHVIPHSERPLR